MQEEFRTVNLSDNEGTDTTDTTVVFENQSGKKDKNTQLRSSEPFEKPFGDTSNPSTLSKGKESNKYTKWLIFSAAAALLVLLGLMIVSVIIGVAITEETHLGNNNELLSTKDGNVVKTNQALYAYSLSLNTPVPVLDGIKSVDVNISVNGTASLFHMEINSYLLVPGQQLLLYGENYQVRVNSDSSLTLETLSKNFPFSQQKRQDDTSTDVTVNSATVSSTSSVDNVPPPSDPNIYISTCSELVNISQPDGSYMLLADLDCTLQAPLLKGIPFTGVFDGLIYSITVNLNYDCHAGLFDILGGGVIQNLVIKGRISGKGRVGAVAATAHNGSLIAVGSYATIVSSGPLNSHSLSVAGGFIGFASLSGQLYFQGCVSQGSVNAHGASAGDNFAAGFVGAFVKDNSYNQIYFVTSISVVNSLTANGNTDPFVNALLPSFSLCNTNCGNNLFSQNCYFDESFGTSFATQLYASNYLLTCPPVLFENGLFFDFKCFGPQHSQPTQSIVLPARKCAPCVLLCIRGYHCICGRCIPELPIIL